MFVVCLIHWSCHVFVMRLIPRSCNVFVVHLIHGSCHVFVVLGVRSLTNASRARQFNPLNPPGVGWVPLPQTNMAAVVGRAWSCRSARFAASTAVARTNKI